MALVLLLKEHEYVVGKNEMIDQAFDKRKG